MEKIYMLSVVIEAFKHSLMFLCKPSQIVVWYTATGLYITLHTELTSQTRRDSPCADSPDRDLGFSWGRDSVSVVRIREGFLKKIYENFVGTLETVRNRAGCL